MTTNCVLLAESIVCQAGTDILNLTGIISPGTLYDYLDGKSLARAAWSFPVTPTGWRGAKSGCCMAKNRPTVAFA